MTRLFVVHDVNKSVSALNVTAECAWPATGSGSTGPESI